MSSFQPELLHLTSDEKSLKTSTKRQYYAAFIMSLLSFSYGCCCGWPSAAVLLLTSEYDTPLETGPISSDEVGWIASGIGIGGFIGNLLFGWVKNLIKNFVHKGSFVNYVTLKMDPLIDIVKLFVWNNISSVTLFMNDP